MSLLWTREAVKQVTHGHLKQPTAEQMVTSYTIDWMDWEEEAKE